MRVIKSTSDEQAPNDAVINNTMQVTIQVTMQPTEGQALTHIQRAREGEQGENMGE